MLIFLGCPCLSTHVLEVIQNISDNMIDKIINKWYNIKYKIMGDTMKDIKKIRIMWKTKIPNIIMKDIGLV